MKTIRPLVALSLLTLLSAQSLEAELVASDISPSDGERNVELSTSIRLRLSEPAKVDTLPHLELYRIEEGTRVEKATTRYATDLTNAAITIVPRDLLEPGATYELVGSAKVESTGGSRLTPFSSRFHTVSAAAPTESGLVFEPHTFDRNRSMTTVEFGPDGRLYAADAFGTLARWDIDEHGVPIKRAVLLSDPSESRQYIDLAWDPAATADSLVLWVSYGERLDYAPSRKYYTGAIAKLTIGENVKQEVVVTGLPHGRERQGGFDTLPHQPNGLLFKDGKLYQTVGSTSSSGGPANWGVPEQTLSGAAIQIDYKAIKETLDMHPDYGYDPSRPGAPLQLFATGIRNALHLVGHSNGRIYTAVNLNDRRGPADGVPDHPRIPGDQNLLVKQTTPDHESLLIVEEGRHYGFPNPARNQYVLMGGNPTAVNDPFEISDYPVGTAPDDGFAPELMYPIWQYGGTSPNGMIEYQPQFPHPLRGALLCCFYSAGDIAAMPLGADGLPTSVKKLRGPKNKLPFNGPLDLTMDPRTGILYVADFGTQNKFGSDGSMILLRPLDPDPQ